MTEEESRSIGNAVLAEAIRSLSIPAIREAAGAIGMDAPQIPAASEAAGGMGSRAEVVPVIQRLFGELSHEARHRAVPILCERISARGDEPRERLSKLLAHYGYQFEDGQLVKMGALDKGESKFLPGSAVAELEKAVGRLAAGDESGAITSACGAVDATTTALYEKHNPGKPDASFQTKVNTVFNRLGVFEKLEKELQELAIKPEDAKKIREEIQEATRHATEALQLILRVAGDVHGTKATFTRLVYDTIKWSSAVCGLLEGE